ncbi:MAG: hypothetical protein US42_C0018G0029 [Candidatus Magasanikbacteria bacterium GW2011_GWC2_37_14]|uniref:Uncharacterized protein n=1 Tax=Candidatus Magasanikbacteria bacterium GW2011_GWC2_37_14 TaxID=1619046 RepID=A0A0G0GLC4_9BACT|nr:MAG: hypothetical protein US42_C0018G0029 [Candidatus Magasanikbacteria bacterium GW2011_GWC2_37_14]
MTLETEQANLRRRGVESREFGVENKESKENEELKAAAAMERADTIIREAKNSKKQMQNIVVHMQTVISAIRQLRTQLQLVQKDDDDSSVKQDKKKIAELTKKLEDYGDELIKMKADLIREQMEELKNDIGEGGSLEELQKKAEALVEELIKQVKQ